MAKERKRSKRKGKCRTNGCQSRPFSRDLCQTCLRDAWDQIHRGEVTEEELVERGLMAPRERVGRPRVSKFGKQLERAGK